MDFVLSKPPYSIAYKKLSFPLFNNGDHYRDFTYVDDAINICLALLNKKMSKED